MLVCWWIFRPIIDVLEGRPFDLKYVIIWINNLLCLYLPINIMYEDASYYYYRPHLQC